MQNNNKLIFEACKKSREIISGKPSSSSEVQSIKKYYMQAVVGMSY